MADPGFVDIDRNVGGLGNALRPPIGLGQSPRRAQWAKPPEVNTPVPSSSLSLSHDDAYTPLIESK